MIDEVKRTGKVDERLEYVLSSVKKAVEIFLEGLKKMEYEMRFKAFDVSVLPENDKNALVNLLIDAFAIEIGKVAKETLDDIKYGYEVENKDDGSFSFWFNAKKEKMNWDEVGKEEYVNINEVRGVPPVEPVESVE